jgi:hypothetical protein
MLIFSFIRVMFNCQKKCKGAHDANLKTIEGVGFTKIRAKEVHVSITTFSS